MNLHSNKQHNLEAVTSSEHKIEVEKQGKIVRSTLLEKLFDPYFGSVRKLWQFGIVYLFLTLLAFISACVIEAFGGTSITAASSATVILNGLIFTYNQRKLTWWRSLFASGVCCLAPLVCFIYLQRLGLLALLPLLVWQAICLFLATAGAYFLVVIRADLALYLFFGGLTTIVSIGSFSIFDILIGKTTKAGWLLPQIMSFVISCIFAFFMNRWFVFKSHGAVYHEFIKFISARIGSSLVLEFALMALLVDFLLLNRDFSKIICAILVVVSNYFLSLLFVFRSRHNDN